MRFALCMAAILIAGCHEVHAEPLICTPTQKFYCTANGCREIPAQTWALVDAIKGMYARCDKNGCDRYDAAVSRSGVMTNIEVPARALFARFSGSGEAFVEVASQLTDIYVSHGSCKSQ